MPSPCIIAMPVRSAARRRSALTGGTTSAPKNPRDGSALNSMLSVVINPDALAGTNVLLDETTAFLDYVRTARLRTGFDEILLPGEPEQRAREARAELVPVDDGTLAELRKAASTAGLDDAHIDTLLS